MDNLPEFETPATSTEPKPPKKPRQKPARKRRKRRAMKVAAPKRVPIKRRKRRTFAPKVVKVPSLAVMFAACSKITSILRGLTPKERNAVLESVGHIT